MQKHWSLSTTDLDFTATFMYILYIFMAEKLLLHLKHVFYLFIFFGDVLLRFVIVKYLCSSGNFLVKKDFEVLSLN